MLAFPVCLFSEQGDFSEGEKLFSYEGNIYTCKGITGIAFHDGLKVCESARKIYETEPEVFGKNMTCWLTPSCEPWDDKDKSNMKGYYIHSLNGVVVHFAAYQLYLELKKAYPINDTENYPFIRDIDKYVNHPRKTRDFANEVKIFTEIKTYDEYVSYLRKKGEKPFGLLASQDGFVFVRKMLPYDYISHFAFPNHINNKSAAWYKWMLYSNLSEYYFQKALEEKDTKKALTDEILFQYTSSSYVLVQNAKSGDRQTVLKILKSLILEPEGKVARQGIIKANEVMKELNLPIKFLLGQCLNSGLAEHFGMEIPDLKQNVLISLPPVSEKSRHTKQDSFIYIFNIDQKKIPQKNLDMMIYLLGKKKLLAPMVNEILDKLEVFPPFKKPTINMVLNQVHVPTSLPGVQRQMEEDEKKKK